MLKYATSEKQIDVDVLSIKDLIYSVIVDILSQIQLQIANNENALLGQWS